MGCQPRNSLFVIVPTCGPGDDNFLTSAQGDPLEACRDLVMLSGSFLPACFNGMPLLSSWLLLAAAGCCWLLLLLVEPCRALQGLAIPLRSHQSRCGDAAAAAG